MTKDKKIIEATKEIEKIKRGETIPKEYPKEKEYSEVTKELAEEAGIEKQNNDLKTFIFDKNLVIETKTFSSHLLNGNNFGFGLLLPRMEDINDRKGNKIGEKQVWRPVVITSDKRGLVVSQWMMNDYKIRYEEIPYQMILRWELKDIDTYLHKNPPIIFGKELFEDIKNQYNYYLFYREKNWYNVNSLWDIGTYFHQLFSAFPLKEERGLSGTAKTKSMVVSSYITLNATEIMTNPSESTLFRETESLRPTKYVDEAEKLFKWTKEGLEPDNRVELINSSYTKNGVVPRQEKFGNQYITKHYHVYSPTRISSINGLYGATESRAITQIHTKAPDKDSRGEKDPEDDYDNVKWSQIRNKCYLFALQNWKIVLETYKNFDIKTDLKKRDLQLWKPLIVLASVIDDNLMKEIIQFAEKISKQRKADYLSEGTSDYKFLDCLNHLLLTSTSERIYINLVRERYNAVYAMKEPTNYGYNKTISTHLDKLGFKDLRNKDMRGSYYEITKSIFDEIITPITSDFSSEPSYSSELPINDSKNNDECMMNNDEYSNKNNQEIKKYDEYDGNDEYDEYSKQGVSDEKM